MRGFVSSRLGLMIITTLAWQLMCLALLLVYPFTVEPAVISTYSAWIGDIEANYGKFDRAATYLGIAVVTAPATAIALFLFDRLSQSQARGRVFVIVFLGWQVAVVLALIGSYETGLAYRINQLGWSIFGPPDDVYSFRNLVVPMMIAWQLCTTPIAFLALWVKTALIRNDLGAAVH
jgi:hypothetical protein